MHVVAENYEQTDTHTYTRDNYSNPRCAHAMSIPRCADSVDIRILGLCCSWRHIQQANDAVTSERSIFSENQDYIKVFPCRG